MTLTLSDGKYAFWKDEAGNLFCKRYGEAWREFVGDNAVTTLFDFACELSERAKSLEESR